MLEEWRTVNLAEGAIVGNLFLRFNTLFLTYQSHLIPRAPPTFVLSSLFDVQKRAFPRINTLTTIFEEERKMKTLIIVTLLLALAPALTSTVLAQPIDFDNLHVASTTYGIVAGQGYPRLLVAYNNKIYFIVTEDGTANPSKVCCYDPSDGLSNTVNHSIVKETTGQFLTLRQIDSLLYFSDNLGHVYFYDGSTVTEMSGTPFTASDHVSSVEKFKGLMYFATSTGNIFRYDGLTFEPVREIGENRLIVDMVAWQKDGYLYVSVGPDKVICCPPLGYVIRSSSADAGSWETVLGGNYYSMLFMPTADYLYTAVMDSAYWHGSTIRKSSVGTTFPIIYPSDGQYKRMWGSLYYEGIAYFFTDDDLTPVYVPHAIRGLSTFSLVYS
jgi:hypothetical protein